ncbi:adenine nucleotide alpha hydrolases-like protein [Lophium mytilinum]|uniref:Diphthine--ammonia ligase n=1 Tax=Lophium mytilinum TaxID=390894 RepID=A0A6A6R664_9PEZI|nr:adenine nucleotide alpha hydrolases-like protein [Lophium mytilinum]
MPGLKVIALISGGKDSLYSILHCLANGHSIIALANLYPAPPANADIENSPEDDDLDSYMYQTVGHSVIPLYAQALALPLYRQPILGTAVNVEKEYAPAPTVPSLEQDAGTAESAAHEKDETESLIPLLKRILQAHPSANAVSTGAILSTYQRTRVESVAIRLGLVPLSFLWQYRALPPYSQAALLEDMAAVGQEARIVKVASGGLDEGFLWEDVAAPRTVGRLKRVMGRFGAADGAVVGEGGEFETLAVDGPRALWRMRIEVEVGGTVLGGGGSAAVRFRGARVVEKEGDGDGDGMERLRRPGLLDVEFESLFKSSAGEESMPTAKASVPVQELSNLSIGQQKLPTWELAESGNILSISNMTAPEADTDASAQLSSIMARLMSLLQSYECEPASVVSSTLLLRSMSDFTAINLIYGAHFTKPIPPSRVTVACGSSLPEGIEVVLSVIISKSTTRRGLHVQSRSYWAPANIGPYSQAVTVPIDGLPKDEQDGPIWNSPQIVYLAGQIPLVPATMEIVKADTAQETQGGLEGFKIQTVLALQHLWRIGRVMNIGWWTGGIAFISHCSSDEGDRRAKLAAEAWRAIHLKLRPDLTSEEEDAEEQDNDLDVWHTKHGGFSGEEGVEKDQRPALPDYERVNGGDAAAIPPCFTVQVQELPRAADIEWSSVGVAKASVSVKLTAGTPSLHLTRVPDTSSSFVFVGIEDSDVRGRIYSEDDTEKIQRLSASVENRYVVYTSQALPTEWLEDIEIKKQIVPCQRVWDESGHQLAAAVVVRRNTEVLTH